MALAMLLRLKEFAVRAYGLQPDRVRAFATATAEKKRLVREVHLSEGHAVR